MRTTVWYALPCAGLLVISANGCASRQSTASPTASHVAGAQEESQKALDRAAKAQERASQQADRVADAQRELQDAQRRVTEAQHTLETEQQKAEQLQQEAIQARREATTQAEAAQKEASRALQQQGEQVKSQQQELSGQITRASADSIVVTPERGEPMTFKVTGATDVRIDGRQASAGEVQQGADARVSYEMSGTDATAVTVQVITGQPPQRAEPPAGDRGATTPQEPGAPTAPSQPSTPSRDRP
jgi:hypothetical protein